MKKCPFCAEEIQVEAVYCRHCHNWLEKSQQVSTEKQQNSALWIWGWLLFVFTIVYIFIIYNWFASGTFFENMFTWGIVLWFVSLIFVIGIFQTSTKWHWAPKILFSILLNVGLQYSIGFIAGYTASRTLTFEETQALFFPNPPQTRSVAKAPTTAQSQKNIIPTTTPTIIKKVAGSKIVTPGFGELVITGTHQSSSGTSDWLDWARGHARNLALTEPYDWEYFIANRSTRYRDVETYYQERLTKMGYRMTFNEEGMNEVYLLKFKRESSIVTIQFWAATIGEDPAILIFYQNWK